MTIKNVEKAIYEILDTDFWPKDLSTDESYVRVHDDCDGNYTQTICVGFSHDGDAWVTIPSNRILRFRGPFGGGMSSRVRNALLILAVAIKKDNEMSPQR